VSGQLHTLAVLNPGKITLVPTECKAMCASQPVRMFWRRQQSLVPARIWTLTHAACSPVTTQTTLSLYDMYYSVIHWFPVTNIFSSDLIIILISTCLTRVNRFIRSDSTIVQLQSYGICVHGQLERQQCRLTFYKYEFVFLPQHIAAKPFNATFYMNFHTMYNTSNP